MSGVEDPRATVTLTLTKHDTEIPGLGETRENWRAAFDGLDAVARGRTADRALENLTGFIRRDDGQGSLEDRLDVDGDGGGEL